MDIKNMTFKELTMEKASLEKEIYAYQAQIQHLQKEIETPWGKLNLVNKLLEKQESKQASSFEEKVKLYLDSTKQSLYTEATNFFRDLGLATQGIFQESKQRVLTLSIEKKTNLKGLQENIERILPFILPIKGIISLNIMDNDLSESHSYMLIYLAKEDKAQELPQGWSIFDNYYSRGIKQHCSSLAKALLWIQKYAYYGDAEDEVENESWWELFC